MTRRKLRVCFVHPDLGIGGAEMLVVNAAMSLVDREREVVILTSHHDPKHCFHETLQDGKAPLSGMVKVHGDWIPRTLAGGRFIALCAIIRMTWVSLVVLASSLIHALTFGAGGSRYDVIFVDQVSYVVPLLRLCGAPVLFYCHFPDKLLCTEEARAASALKRMYRAPLDAAEEVTTGCADMIMLNSKFTVSVFKTAFARLARNESLVKRLRVLYPAIDLAQFDRALDAQASEEAKRGLPSLPASAITLLSINRFERKKNLVLAIKALGKLKSLVDAKTFRRVHLILAGGYDERVAENVEHYKELEQAARDLSLEEKVHFVRSFTNDQRLVLMDACRAVVYTPDKEHFGIVPIEAMYAGCPVVAVASGGPLESVVDQVTGYLKEGTPDAFAEAFAPLVDSAETSSQMGKAGRSHVASKFSLRAFGDELDAAVADLAAVRTSASYHASAAIVFGLAAAVALIMMHSY